MKKWKKVAKQYTEILEQSDLHGIYPKLRNAEEQKLKRNLVWGKVGFSWIGMVLLVSQSEAKNDSQLRKKLLAYNNSLHEALSLAVTASRTLLHGWAWHKGDLLNASGAGGVYWKP